MQGTITFFGGGAIPAGILKVHLEDPFATAKVKSSLGETQLKSSGKDDAISFSLPAADARPASGTLEVVVRLERKDGWLIGHGTQQFKPGETINVAVNTVQY